MPAHSPLQCSHSAMSARGSNEVVLMNTGSYPGISNYLNETWKWNGTDWSTSVTSGAIDPNGPLPTRSDFAMGYDGNSKLILFGGRGSSSSTGVLNDTWSWNGTVWTKLTPSVSPFGRFKCELANFGSNVILFGGSNTLNYLNETWSWSGSTWTQLTPSTSPSARIDFAMANGTSYVLLFGGKNSNSTLNDTWKFDGVNWTLLSPATSPSVRAECALAYDTAHSNWVLFGGRNDFGVLAPETWIFNGITWTRQAPAVTPPGRVGAQMTYDVQSSKIILVGGNDTTTVYNDTWAWSGTGWVQL